MPETTTLERAFALARSGSHLGVSDIRLTLKREGFDHVEGHLAGASIGRQLKALCRIARSPD